MQKKLVLIIIAIAVLLAGSVLSWALTGVSDCEYDRSFDDDDDYIMNTGADCGADYQYDCDDSDKDVFRGCDEDQAAPAELKVSLFSRIIAWLQGRGAAEQGNRQNNIISSNAVRTIFPGSDEAIAHIKRMNEQAGEQASGTQVSGQCDSVTICRNMNLREVYCPLDYDECCEKYSECRVISCDEEYCMPEETGAAVDGYPEEYHYTGLDDEEPCYEEYNDCIDKGEAVVCKGPFEACAASFEGCRCGTGEDMEEYGDQAEPDFTSDGPVDCDTGVFVCSRQVITMSGDVAESIVTCKESFQRCSQTYGNCRCGNTTLTDFPTQYIGETGIDDSGDNANNYWCDYEGRQIPCYMLPGNCTKKRNTCDKGNGVWITCDGSFVYCNNKYDGKCICGVETPSTGFMVTSSE
ncbi:hypothetical protein JW898_04535 [Candidatus Woesearchaeota archaeon]|nr:hypothetical protein [Candidatus Woesearchaeota archaeon]